MLARIAAVILLVALGLFLFLFGTSPLNNIAASFSSPDKTCTANDECVMMKVDCSICDYGSRGEAVNKNYRPFCPLPMTGLFGGACPFAMPKWSFLEAVCENGRCVAKEKAGGLRP